MRYALRLKYLATVIMVFCIGVCFGQIEGNPELLLLIGKENLANRTAIISWQGNAVFDFKFKKLVAGKIVNEEWTRNVFFAYDRGSNALFTLSNQTLAGNNATDPKGMPIKHMQWGKLETNEGVYELNLWDPKSVGNKSALLTKRSMVLASKANDRRGIFLNNFDPFCYLEITDMDVNKRMSFLYSIAKESTFKGAKVTKDNGTILLAMKNENVFNEYIFDLAQGANPTKIKQKDSALSTNQIRTFEKIDDVWLPKKIHVDKIFNDGGSTESIDVDFNNEIVNGPIDPANFVLSKFGLEKDDEIFDQRSGVTYLYNGNADIVSKPEPTPKSNLVKPVLVICAVFVCLLISAFVVLILKKKKVGG